MFAAFRFEVLKFSSFHLYQKCPFKTFYGLDDILKVSKTSKLHVQTRPTFTAIAPLNFYPLPWIPRNRSTRFLSIAMDVSPAGEEIGACYVAGVAAGRGEG